MIHLAEEFLQQPPVIWGLVSLVALGGICVIPSFLLVYIGDVSIEIVIAGATIFALSVLLKRALGIAIQIPLLTVQTVVVKSAISGLLSASTELGAAGVYLWMRDYKTLMEVVAFGIGAGSAEALYVLCLSLFMRADPKDEKAWAQAATNSLWVRYTVPLERFLASIGHIGSRGLVWLGLMSTSLLNTLWFWGLALVLFTAVDGVAAYGLRQKWNWSDPTTCRFSHLYFGMLSFSEMAIFLLAFSVLHR